MGLRGLEDHEILSTKLTKINRLTNEITVKIAADEFKRKLPELLRLQKGDFLMDLVFYTI